MLSIADGAYKWSHFCSKCAAWQMRNPLEIPFDQAENAAKARVLDKDGRTGAD
jgi:hypothetical protein